MPRPHEDLERHTDVDHTAGGPPVDFAPGDWCAIEIASVKAGRSGAGVSAIETLIEKARKSAVQAGASAVLLSSDERRVITLLQLHGHDAYRRLDAAWDEHHLLAEHRAISERATRALYRTTAAAGEAGLDPQTHDAYAVENIARGVDVTQRLLEAMRAADGFRGALVFTIEAGGASILVYRFAHLAEIDVFRSGGTAVALLGPGGAASDSFAMAHPVKTFAP